MAWARKQGDRDRGKVPVAVVKVPHEKFVAELALESANPHTYQCIVRFDKPGVPDFQDGVYLKHYAYRSAEGGERTNNAGMVSYQTAGGKRQRSLLGFGVRRLAAELAATRSYELDELDEFYTSNYAGMTVRGDDEDPYEDETDPVRELVSGNYTWGEARRVKGVKYKNTRTRGGWDGARGSTQEQAAPRCYAFMRIYWSRVESMKDKELARIEKLIAEHTVESCADCARLAEEATEAFRNAAFAKTLREDGRKRREAARLAKLKQMNMEFAKLWDERMDFVTRPAWHISREECTVITEGIPTVSRVLIS